MSHLSAARVAAMSEVQRVVATAYRVGWVSPPTVFGWDTDLTGIGADLIRFLLWPLLEPKYHDGPYTVICSDGTPKTETQVADAGASFCGLSRNSGELDIDLLGRCLQAEEAN